MTKFTKSNIHLISGWTGLVGIAAVWMGKSDLVGDTAGLVGGLVFLTSALALFLTRNADKYVAALWRTGANAAFLGLLAWYLFVPFVEGVMDGASGSARQLDFPSDMAPDFAFAMFFIAHTWARLRGTA